MFSLLGSDRNSSKASPTFGHAMQIFLRLYRPYKESISKALNNDDLNLHSVTKFRLALLLVNWKAQTYC